jgi:hypothetical protein
MVQDYEPGFQPWSSAFAVTRATYHAGFVPVVNSFPLARYLERQEGISVPDAAVLAPDLDLARLERVAAARTPAVRPRVFFYARPSKPRNLFPTGVAALRRAADLLGPSDVPLDVVTAGEPHEPLELRHGARARSLGTLRWDQYYDQLEHSDVGLSLMHSPHPSHPPLELAVSGARAVTNDFEGARSGLHPRLVAPAADPDELAAAIVEAVRRAADGDRGGFEPIADGRLGQTIDAVVRSAAAAVR